MDKEIMERNLYDDLIRANRELETRLQECNQVLPRRR